MKLTHKLLLAACLMVIMVLSNAQACSIAVNNNAQKNMLAALAASHLSLSFTTITSTSIEDYDVSTTGGSGSSCPDYLITEARVSFQYKPSAHENCDAQVFIRRSQFMGELEDLTGAFDDSEFSGMTAACSTTLPIRIKKPVKIPPKPFPYPVNVPPRDA